MRQFLLALIVSLIVPNVAFAAWVATDNFDSYSDGDLNNGAGGTGWSTNWSGNAIYDIQGTVKFQGTKAVQYVDAAAEPEIGRTYAGVTDGCTHVAIRRNASADILEYWIAEGGIAEANRVFGIQMFNLNINVVGSASTNLGAYALDTWYEVDFEYDASTDQFRARLDGGTYTAWLNARTTETQVDGLLLRNGANGGASTSYWDDIRACTVAATGGMLADPHSSWFTMLEI